MTGKKTLELVRESKVAIPTNEQWRGLMERARKEKGLTQGQLAGKVGCSQPNVSDIENGKVKQSTDVPAICGVLSIPLPFIFVGDEIDSRWVDAGRILRHHNPSLFERQVENIEAIVEAFVDSDDELQ